MVRHTKKFRVSRKATQISYHPDDNSYHEVREWAVEIGISNVKGVFNTLAPLTYSDLIRLRRVVNRAIKIVQNPKKHETDLTF